MTGENLGKRVAFVGSGNMARALMEGMLRAGSCRRDQIVAMDTRESRVAELREALEITGETNLERAIHEADVVFLSTKPQVFDRILPALAQAYRATTLYVSVAAGVPTRAIERALPEGARVVRTMPNTPALVDAGATAIAAGSHATDEDVVLVSQLFSSVGTTLTVDESALDAVTGLSGSGPAYVFLIIEALADAGVKVGLGRRDAQSLAAQTVLGSAKLLIETGEHPGRLKDMVTSPGGTAIAGLHTLESGGLRTTLIDAVESATSRAKELGQELDERLKP